MSETIKLNDGIEINIPSLDNTRIRSIIVTRAIALDNIAGEEINLDQNKKIKVPFDIDDLEVSDDNVKKNTFETITRFAADNPLNWQNAGADAYPDYVKQYSQKLKEIYTRKVTESNAKTTITSISTPSGARKVIINKGPLREIDITEFSTIQTLSRQMGNAAVATISVSLIKLREAGTDAQILPRENDVVEIKLEYPSINKVVRAFIGVITIINTIETYGQVTNLVLSCAGILKFLSIHKMVADRAVVSQFESGELLQPSITPWSTNAFAANTADEIFTSIMISQLAMKVDTQNKTDKDTQQYLKAEAISAQTMAQRLETSILAISKTINTTVDKNSQIVDAAINKPIPAKSVVDHTTDLVNNTPNDTYGFQSMDILYGIINKSMLSPNINKLSELLPADLELRANMRSLAVYLLIKKLLYERIKVIQNKLEKLADEEIKARKKEQIEALPLSTLTFKFDKNAITDISNFQLLYIPLISSIMARQNEVVAEFKGRQLAVFDLIIRSGFNLFFSQLKTPYEILNTLESTSKLFIYENEDGKMICEVPRYNDFAADTGENIADFIIVNPLNCTISRQDVDLITRKDVKKYIPYIGRLDATGTLTSRYYTDPAVLARYGMRATDPVYNPNAVDNFSAGIYAAIETTNLNATTRTMSTTVDGSRPYKLGRLYFIARNVNSKMNEVLDNKPIDGYVGYLVSYNTNITPGSTITHSLQFIYVRKARLLKNDEGIIKANFKILPDVHGLLRVLSAAVNKGELDYNAIKPSSDFEKIGGQSAEVINTDEDAVYVRPLTDIYAPDKTVIGLEHTHHEINLPPYQKTSKRMAVCQVSKMGAGLNQDVVNTMGAIDLWFRTISHDTQLMGKYTSSIRSDIFNFIYLPTFAYNQGARLMDLKGLTMTIIRNPLDPYQSVKGEIIQIANPEESEIILPFMYDFKSLTSTAPRGIYVHGTPIRLVDDQIDTFVILRPYPTNILAGKIIIEDVGTIPVSLSSITEIKSNEDGIIDYLKNTVGIEDAKKQFDAAISYFITGTGASLTVEQAYLPVVFHKPLPQNLMLQYYTPGIPLSIYDTIAIDIDNMIRGVTQVSPNSGAGALDHAMGYAVDFSLIPYYVATGLVLKENPLQNLLLQTPYKKGILGRLMKSIKDPVVYYRNIQQSLSNVLLNLPTVTAHKSKTIYDEFDQTIQRRTGGYMTIQDMGLDADKGYYHIKKIYTIG